jgi:hypothetical protein
VIQTVTIPANLPQPRPRPQANAAALVFPTRLYGREHAAEALRAAYARVCTEQTFGVSVVHGPSGIGKSSLLAQLVADPQLRDAAVIFARADQYGGDAPYASLIDGLRRLVVGILAQSDAAVLVGPGENDGGIAQLRVGH